MLPSTPVTATTNPPVETRAEGRTFFGHPRGLATLFSTELWERFSYYGMRAILLLYLTAKLREGGLGLDASLGEAVVSVYGASVYLLSVVGGWLADRVMGARRTTLIGALIIISGHLSLSVPTPALSYLGIALVALGSGIFKPNVSTMVGGLYSEDDTRRTSAFSIFYMGINIGALCSPWVVGWLRGAWGFHAGFAAAAVGMGLALVAWVWGRKALGDVGLQAPNPVAEHERGALSRVAGIILAGIAAAMVVATVVNGGSFGLETMVDAISYVALVTPVVFFVVMYRSDKVEAHEKRRLLAYIPLFVAAMLFFMLFEQASTTLTTFAADRTDLQVFGAHISPEFFQSVNPFAIILLTPVFAALWLRRGERTPHLGGKFAIGLGLAGASFAIMALASFLTGDAKASPFWLILVYVVQTVGELCLSPVGLAATTLLAPKAFRSQTMALWFLAPAAGQAITAQVVQATSGASDTAYFGGLAVVTLAFTAVLAGLAGWVHRQSGH